MAVFETIIILRTDIPDARRDTIVNSLTELIQSFSKKKKVNINIVGEKRLAFPLSKSETGFYVMFTYEATDSDVITLEKHLLITDEIIKFMSLKLDEEENTIDELEDLDISEHTTIPDLYPEIKSTTKKNKPIDALILIYGIE